MSNRVAAFARRASTPVVLGPAVLALALLAAPTIFPSPARGQQAGDKVVITMKSGKKYTVELISKGESEVKFKLGTSEMAVPASMVSSIEAVEGAGGDSRPTPAPAPSPAPAPAARTGSGEAPTPSVITMKDGTVLTGFVVGKGDGKVWIVEGEPRALGEAFIAKTEAGTGGSGGSGGGTEAATMTGSSSDRARALVREFASADDARQLSAYSALEALGPSAIADAVLEGMGDKDPRVRRMCVSLAARVRQESALKTIYTMLEKDEDNSVRKATAETLGSWPAEGAPEALLHSAGWDRNADVRTASLTSLTRYAGPEMAKTLIDMLADFPDDATALPALFGALRHATGKELWTSKDRAGWAKWWNEEGGRQEIDDVIAEKKRKETFKEGEGEGEGEK